MPTDYAALTAHAAARTALDLAQANLSRAEEDVRTAAVDLNNCQAALNRCLADALNGNATAQEVLSHCYSEKRTSAETVRSSVKRLLAADAALDAATAHEATTRAAVEQAAQEAHNPSNRTRDASRALRLML